MAIVARDMVGSRRILFVDPNEKRKAIRLGKVSQQAADQVKCRVDRLLEAKLINHALEADTARWVADLDQQLSDKLARVGLIPKAEREVTMTFGTFLDDGLEHEGI